MGQLQGQAGVGDRMHGARRLLSAAFGKLAQESSELRKERACLQAEMTETENPKLWGDRKFGKGNCLEVKWEERRKNAPALKSS